MTSAMLHRLISFCIADLLNCQGKRQIAVWKYGLNGSLPGTLLGVCCLRLAESRFDLLFFRRADAYRYGATGPVALLEAIAADFGKLCSLSQQPLHDTGRQNPA